MSDELISIIIPVYNTEQYLDRCVESVLAQSYRAVEVLLIDDGSTDSSGALCDRWAEKDARVRVVHKENGGSSSARNIGLDMAKGDYIAFADSDDYLAPDMLALLYSALKSNLADMSICNFHFVDETGAYTEGEKLASPITAGVDTGFDIIKKIVGKNSWYYHPAWNKLYKRSLFSDIRFPLGVVCGEDAFIVHRLLGKCSAVACIDDRCYYYTQRADSVTSNRSQRDILTDAESFLDRAIYCYENGLYEDAGRFYRAAIMILPEVCTTATLESGVQDELHRTVQLFRQNRKIGSSFTLWKKAQLAFALQSPRLYRLLLLNPFVQKTKETIRARLKH